MKRIAFATCRDLPTLAADERLVSEALARDGVAVAAAVWDDPLVRWEQYDAVVVRSTWDYHLRPDQFAAWIDRLEAARVPLWNPAPLLRWNLNKRYLADLAGRGLPVVPTAFLPAGAPANLAAILAEHGWEKAVVKPAVSASSHTTWCTTAAKAAADQGQFEAMLRQGDLLIQRYLPEILSAGEWSFIFLGGTYSHAVIKRPRQGDFRVQSAFGGTCEPENPPHLLMAQAERVVKAIDGPWLYARVDGVEVDGDLRLMELELIEPALFLTSDARGVECFARATLAALG